MAKSPLRVLPCPLDLAWNNPSENLKKIESSLRTNLENSSVPEEFLFLFPELSLTGFVTENPPSFSLRENRSALAALAKIPDRDRGGFREESKDPKRPFNTLALFGPNGKIWEIPQAAPVHGGKGPETEVFTAETTQ